MRRVSRTSTAVGIVLAAAIAGSGVSLAQNGADPNSAPNPYRVDVGWAKLDPARKWGAAVGVDIDRDGKSVWVFDRCAHATDCSDSPLNPIQKFDASGKLVASFGAGMINYPHALHVDRDNNIWVSDGRTKNNGKGHTVMKFSPQGQASDDAGQAGRRGERSGHVQWPIRRPGRARRQHLRGRRSWRRDQRAHGEVHQGRQVHQDLGQEGLRPRRLRYAACARHGFRRTPVRRRPQQQPHPDLRPGGEIPRRVASVRPAERSLSSTRTTSSMSPTRIRASA